MGFIATAAVVVVVGESREVGPVPGADDVVVMGVGALPRAEGGMEVEAAGKEMEGKGKGEAAEGRVVKTERSVRAATLEETCKGLGVGWLRVRVEVFRVVGVADIETQTCAGVDEDDETCMGGVWQAGLFSRWVLVLRLGSAQVALLPGSGSHSLLLPGRPRRPEKFDLS